MIVAEDEDRLFPLRDPVEGGLDLRLELGMLRRPARVRDGALGKLGRLVGGKNDRFRRWSMAALTEIR